MAKTSNGTPFKGNGSCACHSIAVVCGELRRGFEEASDEVATAEGIAAQARLVSYLTETRSTSVASVALKLDIAITLAGLAGGFVSSHELNLLRSAARDLHRIGEAMASAGC